MYMSVWGSSLFVKCLQYCFFPLLLFPVHVDICVCARMLWEQECWSVSVCVWVCGTDVKSLSVFFSPLLSSSPCRGHNTYLHFIHHREPQIETQTVDYLGSVFHCDKSSDYAPSWRNFLFEPRIKDVCSYPFSWAFFIKGQFRLNVFPFVSSCLQFILA